MAIPPKKPALRRKRIGGSASYMYVKIVPTTIQNVDPQLEEDAKERGPRHRGTEMRRHPGLDDQLSRPDRAADEHGARTHQPRKTAGLGR